MLLFRKLRNINIFCNFYNHLTLLKMSSKRMSIDSFVIKHLKLLDTEHDAEIESNRLYTEKLSLIELERRGVCLIKLQISETRTGFYGRNVITFELPQNRQLLLLPSNSITSGDIIGVSNSYDRSILCSGIVVASNKLRIEIAFESDTQQLSQNEYYNLIKLANDVTHRRLKSALNSLRKNNDHNLVRVLFGDSPFSEPPLCNDTINYFNNDLNDSQKEAIRFALNQSEVAMIHGPPGTGKTTTLIEIILQSVRNRNHKLLVCAPSNVAVDNLLEKLALAKQTGVIRLGHPARAVSKLQAYSLDAVISNSHQFWIIQELRNEIDSLRKSKKRLSNDDYSNLRDMRKDLKRREKGMRKYALENAKVILSTLTSASPDGPLKELIKSDGTYPFDAVVIDECSQALEASCWIILPYAKRCVLAGDHKQLPPTILSENAAKNGLEITLMERLLKDFHDNDIMRMLTIQYRMNTNIMKWSSLQFYSGKLISHDSVANHSLNDFINGCDICPLVLIDTAGCDMNELDLADEESKGNEYEADIITVYVNQLIHMGFDASTIGIISPYNLQVEMLRTRILKKHQRIEINSIDGFQGREKEIIILSLVRSNDRKEIGFLSEHRRINVAVTRAKRHLVIVGDSDTLSNDPIIRSLIEHIEECGEIRSAHEFVDDVLNLEDIERPTHLRYKTTEEKSIPKNQKAEHNKDKTNNKRIKDNEQKSHDFHEKLKKKLNKFMFSDLKTLEFPNTLSSFERRMIHECAEKLQLNHESVGENEKRYIIVTKKDHQLSCIDNENLLEQKPQESEDTTEVINEDKEININETMNKPIRSVKKQNVNKSKISQSKSDVNTQTTKACKKSKPNQNQKLKAEPILPDGDDIDALVEAFNKFDKICAFINCKTNIAVLSQHCKFCGRNFCLNHSMPEVHGCGEKVRDYAKSIVRKDGKLYSGTNATPERKTDPIKHNYLKKKLSTKLNDMSNDRKVKKSND